MLYIVGLGLGDERGVTVRGLDAVRRCARVYMEAYTALLTLGLDPPSRLDSLVRFRSGLPTACSLKILPGLAAGRRSRTPPLRSLLQEKLYGKEITVADREMVEEERGGQVLREAAGADIALLVVGHPFG
jgi:diphthine synthase